MIEVGPQATTGPDQDDAVLLRVTVSSTRSPGDAPPRLYVARFRESSRSGETTWVNVEIKPAPADWAPLPFYVNDPTPSTPGQAALAFQISADTSVRIDASGISGTWGIPVDSGALTRLYCKLATDLLGFKAASLAGSSAFSGWNPREVAAELGAAFAPIDGDGSALKIQVAFGAKANLAVVVGQAEPTLVASTLYNEVTADVRQLVQLYVRDSVQGLSQSPITPTPFGYEVTAGAVLRF